MIGIPQGRYRTDPNGNRSPMAYVIDGRSAIFITEEAYRSRGFHPVFDQLPTEDEYDVQK